MGFLVARLYCQQVGPSGNPVTHESEGGFNVRSCNRTLRKSSSRQAESSKKLATQLEAVQESREASH